MKKLVICLVLFPIFFAANAQKFDYGVFIGGNRNFISLRSDYIIQDGTEFKPTLSFNLGGFLKTNNKRINLLGSIEYARIRNTFHQEFKDYIGNKLSESESSITNHCIVINSIGTVYIFEGFYFGTGLSGNILLKSSLKIDANLIVAGEKIGNVFANNNYKSVVLSIPVILGYEFKQISIFTRFNLGLMNRLKYDSYVKEVDNTLILGIGYRINSHVD